MDDGLTLSEKIGFIRDKLESIEKKLAIIAKITFSSARKPKEEKKAPEETPKVEPPAAQPPDRRRTVLSREVEEKPTVTIVREVVAVEPRDWLAEAKALVEAYRPLVEEAEFIFGDDRKHIEELQSEVHVLLELVRRWAENDDSIKAPIK